METHPLYQKVKALLEEVQPMLGLHGGSIELVNITPDNVVELRFLGACVGCKAADITLEYGLKELLMIRVEEISDVVAVNTEPATHDAPHLPLAFQDRG
jgi:Fe-S cluster biogenesis protein NfuA